MLEDNDLIEWYTSERERYEGLSNIVHYLVESLIRNARIDYLSVSSRTKTVDSFIEKTTRKPYKNPQKAITDFSGIRIITFIDSDVEKVADLIKSSFKVYPNKSLDKSDELGTDRFGYRSLHVVCDLGVERFKLPEFSLYRNLVFEVQVRTALQHAWAEIEHDRNYKFAGTLPSAIKRRLNLLAAVLELADREFVAIANDIDKYAEEISKRAQEGDLDEELNTTSIAQYLRQKVVPNLSTIIKEHEDRKLLSQVIEELHDFGISSLADIDKIVNEDYLKVYDESFERMSDIGFLRVAMMYDDIDKYFSKAWKNRYQKIPDPISGFLKRKYKNKKVDEIIRKSGLELGIGGSHTTARKMPSAPAKS